MARLAPTTHTTIFVVSASIKHAVKSVDVITDLTFEPHSPVRMVIDGRPRSEVDRQLASYIAMPAQIPYGPPMCPLATASHDMGGMELDRRYRAVMSMVEHELASLQGVPARAAAELRSRTDGLKFVWRNACAQTAIQSRRTTSASRALRRTAKWLRQAAKSTCAEARREAIWRIQRYAHD